MSWSRFMGILSAGRNERDDRPIEDGSRTRSEISQLTLQVEGANQSLIDLRVRIRRHSLAPGVAETEGEV